MTLGAGLHIKIADTSASANGAADELVIEGTSTVGMSFLTNNDQDSNIMFGDSNANEQGGIKYAHDGDFMVFRINNADRFRCDSAGRLLLGGISSEVTGEGFLQVKGSTNLSAWQVNSNGLVALRFFNASGSGVGGITVNGSGTVYATSSDYRLKENAVAISDGITRLKTLKPYRFNFKADNDKDGNPTETVDGFFAHEVTAVPEAITGEKDGTDMQGIDQSKLVPLLTAALKESIAKNRSS